MKKTTVKTSLRNLHKKHKETSKYTGTLRAYVNDLLRERILFIRRMSTLFMGIYIVLGFFLGMNSRDTVQPFIFIIWWLSTLMATVASVRKYFDFNKTEPAEISDLRQSILFSLDPMSVMRLEINKKDVEQLGGFMKHHLSDDIMLDGEPQWNEVGLNVGVLATRLCLLNMFLAR